MRHRLLGIVIGSRATAVAIIFHYYCHRSARSPSASPHPLSLATTPPAAVPTDIVTTCGVLGRRIETDKFNFRSRFGMQPRDYASGL